MYTHKNDTVSRSFINFGAFFVIFVRKFQEGVIIVPKMLERLPINFNSTRISDSAKIGR